MPNHPSALKALGIVTATLHGGEDEWMAAIADFDSPTEALASLARVSQALVKMLAEALGTTPEKAWEKAALAIQAYDDGE